MEDTRTPHTADWKLGYCRAALECIIKQLEANQPSQFGALTYAKCLAQNALEQTK